MSQIPDVIQFTCHACGMSLTVPAAMAGISGPCPRCQTVLTSPAAAPAPVVAVPPQPQPVFPPAPVQAPSYPPAPVAEALPHVPAWQAPPTGLPSAVQGLPPQAAHAAPVFPTQPPVQAPPPAAEVFPNAPAWQSPPTPPPVEYSAPPPVQQPVFPTAQSAETFPHAPAWQSPPVQQQPQPQPVFPSTPPAEVFPHAPAWQSPPPAPVEQALPAAAQPAYPSAPGVEAFPHAPAWQSPPAPITVEQALPAATQPGFSPAMGVEAFPHAPAWQSPPVAAPAHAQPPVEQVPAPPSAWQQPLSQLPQPRQQGAGTQLPPAAQPWQFPAQGGAAPVGGQPHAHPLLDHLLETPGVPKQQPAAAPAPTLPAAETTFGRAPAPAPVRQRGAEPARGKGGAIVIASVMALLVLAGIGGFFRDSIVGAYRAYQLQKEAEGEPVDLTTLPLPAPQPQPATPPAPASTPFVAPTPAPAVPEVGTMPPLETKPAIVGQPIDDPPAPNFTPTLTSPATSTPPKTMLAEGELPMPPPPVGSGLPVPSLTATVVPTPPPASLVEVPASAVPTTSDGAPKRAEPQRTVQNLTPETKPAVEALEKFFAAANWQERAKYVQSPNQMLPLMEQYYASNPDGPLKVTHITVIRIDHAPETGGPPHCVLQVSGGDVRLPLPVMVEWAEDSWKVDWLTFTEFKDSLLERFLESFVETPQRFHVMIRRTHYFDDDIPELEKKICYEITPPVPGNRFYIFAVKGTALAKELDQNLGWEVGSAAVIVELRWRKQDRYQWVELTGLPQYNWRNPKPLVEGGGGPAVSVPPGMVPAATPAAPQESPPMNLKKKPAKP